MILIEIFFSDGWADRSDVVRGLEEEAHGGMSIKIHSPHVKTFDEYYTLLKPHNNTRNPWFSEFWESHFSCSLSQLVPNFNSSYEMPNHLTQSAKLCNGKNIYL